LNCSFSSSVNELSIAFSNAFCLELSIACEVSFEVPVILDIVSTAFIPVVLVSCSVKLFAISFEAVVLAVLLCSLSSLVAFSILEFTFALSTETIPLSFTTVFPAPDED